jgi:hypothetical protein
MHTRSLELLDVDGAHQAVNTGDAVQLIAVHCRRDAENWAILRKGSDMILEEEGIMTEERERERYHD